MLIGGVCAARVLEAADWVPEAVASRTPGAPFGKSFVFIWTVADPGASPGGRRTRIEVSSTRPSRTAIQGLTASADYVDRWSVRRAGSRGGRLGPRGGSIENAGRPIWQVLFYSHHCPALRARNTAEAGGLILNPAVEFAPAQVRPLFASNPTAAQFTIMTEKAWLGCHCWQIG